MAQCLFKHHSTNRKYEKVRSPCHVRKVFIPDERRMQTSKTPPGCPSRLNVFVFAVLLIKVFIHIFVLEGPHEAPPRWDENDGLDFVSRVTFLK